MGNHGIFENVRCHLRFAGLTVGLLPMTALIWRKSHDNPRMQNEHSLSGRRQSPMQVILWMEAVSGTLAPLTSRQSSRFGPVWGL